MSYVQNTDRDRAAMLEAVGADSVQALMEASIPEACRFEDGLAAGPI